MNKNSAAKPQFSTAIEDFCYMVEDAKSDYDWNKSEITRMDRLTQDYLHSLELEDLSYSERAKIATQLAKCRRERRASKDTVETLQPFIDFIESEKGRQTMNLMKEALGKTRKVEKAMEHRVYRYRELNDGIGGIG